MSEPSVLSDPRALRAIAHPTRSRILDELSASGPARAADLARELGIPANQASFHLRQLAKYGFVEEAPDHARDRRDRVWQVPSTRGYRVSLSAMRETTGGEAAANVYRDHLEARAVELIRHALHSEESPTDSGAERRSIIDSAIRLTPDERDQFVAEISEVLDNWSDRTRDRSVDRQTYSCFLVFQPYPPLDSEE